MSDVPLMLLYMQWF